MPEKRKNLSNSPKNEVNKMSEKTIKDQIVNLLLSLYIIDRVNKIGNLEHQLKLQKVVFLSQKLLNERQRRGLRYLFLRWHQGPFSKQLAEDLKLLNNINFVNWESDSQIKITPEGKKLLEVTHEIFEANPTFLSYIDRIINGYAQALPDEIKDEVYDIKMFIPKIRKVMRIEDAPPKSILMYGLSEKKARFSFNMDDEWLETLEVIFDKEALDLLKKAQHDAKVGRVKC